MNSKLATALRVADVGMLAYWTLATLACFGAVSPARSMMYGGYGTPVIDAWNWSFAPIDLMFAVTGLVSLCAAKRHDAIWRPMALVSLTLMLCAGLMAVSFWALRGEFHLTWWIPNALLVLVASWGILTLSGSFSR